MQLNKAIIEAAIVGFERQKQEIDETIAELRAQLGGTSSPGPKLKVEDAAPPKTKRKMSAKGKAAIRAALKKRWAAYHAKESAPAKKAVPAKKSAPKRKLSPAAKAKLVANLAKARAAKAAKKAAA